MIWKTKKQMQKNMLFGVYSLSKELILEIIMMMIKWNTSCKSDDKSLYWISDYIEVYLI